MQACTFKKTFIITSNPYKTTQLFQSKLGVGGGGGGEGGGGIQSNSYEPGMKIFYPEYIQQQHSESTREQRTALYKSDQHQHPSFKKRKGKKDGFISIHLEARVLPWLISLTGH